MEEQGYDAVLIGTGSGLPAFMDVPGKHLNGMYSTNKFLTHGYEFPRYDELLLHFPGKDVAVIRQQDRAGRNSFGLALGRCQDIDLIYRRSEAEISGREEEVKHAPSSTPTTRDGYLACAARVGN